MGNIERSIEKSLAEMNRILAADNLEHERCGDESHEHFVVRKVLEASGLPNQIQGAVAALREIAYLPHNGATDSQAVAAERGRIARAALGSLGGQ